MADPILCIAGKSRAAVGMLEKTRDLGVRRVCLPNADDIGIHGWQPSLLRAAREERVEIVTLDWAMAQPVLSFLSIEYDRIIRPSRFATRRLFNIHFSLLPKGRGCFTAIWPILNGDLEHGVTLHEIDEGVDSGPIIDQRSFPIDDRMTSRDLYFRCLDLGAALVFEWLPRLLAGSYHSTPQPEEGAVLYRRRDIDLAAEREIDFNASTERVLRRIRAFSFPEYQLPTYGGAGIVAAEAADGDAAPADGGLVMPTADGAVRIWLDRKVEMCSAA